MLIFSVPWLDFKARLRHSSCPPIPPPPQYITCQEAHCQPPCDEPGRMVCAAPEKRSVRASMSPDGVQVPSRSDADGRDLSPNRDNSQLSWLPGLSPGCQQDASLSKCRLERLPWGEVTCFLPIWLTSARSLKMSPLEELGLGWVGLHSSSGRCESEQGQGSWRETGMARAQRCQDGARMRAHSW